ncbi:MAG TPA: glycosyltransferase family 2 protein, partial [Bacteroidota bacterium]|nr:glycosyltransferase family 2 protein [Bacteroidota bacterium]
MSDLSVIIITYNAEQYISSCLESVISQLMGKQQYEVVIVDNASEDSTVGVIQKEFPNLTLIRNGVNRGFAFAVNQGVRSSQGKHILLLNPDAALGKDFFEQLFRFIHENPKVAIVGSKFEDKNGNVQPSCWKTPTLYTTLIESFFPYHLSIKIVTDQLHNVGEVEMVSGGCMLIERS